MAIIDRLFGSRKSESRAPTTERVEQMVATHVERPRPARAMVYREAYVTYNSGYKRRGIVLDHSDTGVRLRFPTNERLPATVTLNASAVGLEGQARVVWQEGSEAGFSLIRR
ncbi:hypothetical protein [Hyphomonas pacifica]|uniref:Uncharacterized protein n=1 Tax=Hyphomonas pacifica TaxID=1280941 RepID=A0A062U0X2_9PROT|nr:hypothetical protein [Hyphomonas pacifica]KCZ48404.1 hypothetical protein HY2_04145 [Hyphomonas pacifica]RAN31716.1 hypothetical protein HY3_03840 [Hyphomonas pacifica]RAN32109.1 hypothetical protein HY11_05905 [Hyphomonas pacifica]